MFGQERLRPAAWGFGDKAAGPESRALSEGWFSVPTYGRGSRAAGGILRRLLRSEASRTVLTGTAAQWLSQLAARIIRRDSWWNSIRDSSSL